MKEKSSPNRLVHEKSLYLQQHAYNPVSWYPWGEEAFQLAEEEDRPIFLSIGYATCHWCHVMEKETFCNDELALLLNEVFVCVKVDREELPNVDALYMELAQAMMSGAAGWPLNLVLSPDLKPIAAATYLPPESRPGLLGVRDFIGEIQQLWKSEMRDSMLAQSEKIVEALRPEPFAKQEVPGEELLEEAFEQLIEMQDPVYGGIEGAPKFPISYQAQYLLRYGVQHQESRALFCVRRFLDMMQRGGIYDHLGGGFSRYSVDEAWLIPHFEKMLYDNALITDGYIEAWQVTGDPLYKRVACETLDYLLRDMEREGGGFYGAEDADSEGEEGKFYSWSLSEVEEILGEEASLFCQFYGVGNPGNFGGRSVLFIRERLEEFAQAVELDQEEIEKSLERSKKKLFEARERRERPLLDDKILVSWNGLAIHAMALGEKAFGDVRYGQAAERAAQFIQEQMWSQEGLLRRWREGEGRFLAGLEDYAFLVKGVLTLFETGKGSRWLGWALQLVEMMEEIFHSPSGAYYSADGKERHLILRRCEMTDGSEPSGNGVHLENLIRLYRMTGDTKYQQRAEGILKELSSNLEQYPPGFCYHLLGLQKWHDHQASTLVVALNEQEEHREQLEQLLYEKTHTSLTLLWRSYGDPAFDLLLPSRESQLPLEGKSTLYLCQGQRCLEPLTDFEEMKRAIEALSS